MKSRREFLNKNIVKYTILGLYLLQIILVSQTPRSVLEAYASVEGRVLVAIVVAYFAYVSPILAISLTITYIITLKELSNRDNKPLSYTGKLYQTDSVKDTARDIDAVVAGYAGKFYSLPGEIQNIVDMKNKIDMNAKLDIKYKLDMNVMPEDKEHPADKTLTDNIQLGKTEWRNLPGIQNNGSGGSEKPMSAFGVVLDAQGYNFISGYNPVSCDKSAV